MTPAAPMSLAPGEREKPAPEGARTTPAAPMSSARAPRPAGPATEPCAIDRTRAAKVYVLVFAGLLATALALVPALVLGLDAQGLFGTRLVPHRLFPSDQRVSSDGDRVVKAVELARRDPEFLIVGSSRAMIALDPTSPLLRPWRAYNAGLAGATPRETLAVLAFAAERAPSLRRVLVVLDVDTFFHPTGLASDFEDSAFNGQGLLRSRLGQLFGVAAFGRSTPVLSDLWRGKPVGGTPIDLGHIPSVQGGTYAQFVSELTAGTSWLVTSRFPPDARAEEPYERLRETLLALKQRGLGVDLAIAPLHAWRLELVERLAPPGLHEAWKRRLAAIAAELGVAPGAGEVRLHDFAVLDPMTSEPVRDTGAALPRHFVESSHALPSVGERMLRIVAGREEPDAATGFGARLTPAAIEAHLDTVAARLQAWRDERPSEVAVVAKVARDAPRPKEPR